VAALLNRLRPGSSVLEVGCGGGVPVAAAIVAAGHAYVGVDVSPNQVGLARHNVPGGQFVVVDVVEAELASPNPFDAVLMLYAITHVSRESWPTVFGKIHGWLASDGRLLLNVPLRESPGWLEEDFLGLGGTNWTNAFDASTTTALLEEHGFEIEEAEQLAEDENDLEGWLWILARPRATRPKTRDSPAH
jgi:cyclopropane fatty-acyl-phospholipid synthase-like methyltransferase